MAPFGEGSRAEREDHHHCGRVTLHGPVNTAEEKRLIGEIADRIARSENVDSQLEVKLTTTSSNY